MVACDSGLGLSWVLVPARVLLAFLVERVSTNLLPRTTLSHKLSHFISIILIHLSPFYLFTHLSRRRHPT